MKQLNLIRDYLISLSLLHKGDFNKIYASLMKHEDIEKQTNDQQCITILDEKVYPNNIKQGFKPPFVIFYEGNIDLLNSEHTKLAIISSRKGQPSSLHYVLDENDTDTIFVLKGKGETDEYIIDNYANKVILVWSTTLRQCPQELKDKVINNGGLVISRLPNNAIDTISPSTFSENSVFFSAVCDKMLVASVIKQSGGLISITSAVSINKDVGVIPTNVYEDFENNALIYEGAIPIYNKVSYKDFVAG